MLFVFNLFFFAIGVTILGLGTWLYIKFDSFLDELAGVDYLNGPILFIVVGSIIAVLAFLGCCGACLENRLLLYLFAFLMMVTFTLELVGGILAVRNDYGSELEKSLNDSLTKYKENGGEKEAWDTVQEELDCCGVNNADDWAVKGDFPRGWVPKSCCETVSCVNNASDKGVMVSDDVYQNGCFKKIKDEFEDNTIAVAAVGIALAVVQILGIIFACYVACKVESGPEVV